MVVNDKTAKLLSVEDVYPCGGNIPTKKYQYQCPCGGGKVEYFRTAGFDDNYAKIQCPICQEKFTLETGKGYAWALKNKE